MTPSRRSPRPRRPTGAPRRSRRREAAARPGAAASFEARPGARGDLLAAVFDVAAALVVVLDREGRIVQWNRACEKLSGYTFAEIADRYAWDVLILPEEAESVRGTFSHLTAGGFPNYRENHWRTKDGTRPLIAWSNTALTGASGEVEYAVCTGIDVTRLRDADAQLRESVADYRALFEQASDGIVITDEAFRFVDVNPRLCEMFGYERDEFMGASVLGLAAPELGPELERSMQALREGQVGPEERQALHKDGRKLTIETHSRWLPDGRLVTIVRDVTERRRAEDALRENESRFRAVIEQASEGITLTDPEWRFLDVNPRVCEMFGYSRDELLRMTVRDIGTLAELEARPLREQELKQGLSTRTVRRLRRKDGSTFPAEISARALPNGQVVSVVQDVTEQQRAEQALRESEARYRAVVEQASDGIWCMDAENRLLEVNARLCEMTGYTREETLGRSVTDFLLPEELARDPLRSDEVTLGRTVLTERSIRRKDGAILPAEISARGLPDGRILGIVRDVTERRRAERALRESEERLRRVVESDMLGILFGLPDGAVYDANDYFLRLVGYTREEVGEGALRWDRIVAPEREAEVRRAVAESQALGSPRPFETEFVRRDGTRVPVLVGVAFLGAEKTSGVGFALDLTERNRARQRLAESERYLKRAQELARFGTWEADLEARRGRWSAEAARIFGLAPAARTVTYEDYVERLHPDDRARVERQLWDLIEGRSAEQEFEHRIVRRDGSVRVVQSIMEPQRDASGRTTRLIGSMQDITERRFLEERLREAQKLEAIGRLAGGVAHDFNNLLTVILGYGETLLGGLPADDPRRAGAEQIRQAALRAAALTQQLLAFGRRQVLEPRVLDLNAVILEMREILQRLMGEKIEVRVSPGAANGLVEADRGQVEQAILNLALNARDAMPDGGRLSLATGDGEARPAEPGGQRPGWLTLTVGDTGRGMSAEVQAHVFEPFFTTKDVGEGAGLGLATVYGIVTQSGGSIEVASAPGQGTTFRILLPTAGGAPAGEPELPAPDEPGGDETILVVEDESAVRSLMGELLRHRGYRVLEAVGGEEALRLSREQEGPLHLLIADVVMPEMDGPDLAKLLSRDRPDLRVLFISGYSEHATAGCFLAKPFTSEALIRTVRQALDAPGPAATEG